MEYSQSNKLLHIINAQLLDFINSGVERTGGNVLILSITLYIKFCITRILLQELTFHTHGTYIVLSLSDVVSGWIRTGTGHCKMKT